MEIRIKNDKIRFIHNDDIMDAMKSLGEVKTNRASHVEPNNNGQWIADMSPVGGPVLGPFDRRDIALKSEVHWLEEHHIPVPVEQNVNPDA